MLMLPPETLRMIGEKLPNTPLSKEEQRELGYRFKRKERRAFTGVCKLFCDAMLGYEHARRVLDFPSFRKFPALKNVKKYAPDLCRIEIDETNKADVSRLVKCIRRRLHFIGEHRRIVYSKTEKGNYLSKENSNFAAMILDYADRGFDHFIEESGYKPGMQPGKKWEALSKAEIICVYLVKQGAKN